MLVMETSDRITLRRRKRERDEEEEERYTEE